MQHTHTCVHINKFIYIYIYIADAIGVYNACQLADKYDLSMTFIRSVCLFASEAIYQPTYLSVGDVIWMWFVNGFALATVIDLRQGKKKVKYNLSKCIVYALGIGNMLFINVWIKNA